MRVNHNGVIGEIDNLPGCSQVAVFHSVFTPEVFRNKGNGTKAHHARLELARELGYDVCLCTVNLANERQLRVLEKHGWKQVHGFASLKTDNKVGIFIKEL